MTKAKDRERLLKEVGKVWKGHPELRFGQLLLNVISDYELYYISDKDTIKRLKVCYALLKGRL
jgi:hypothetical protein